MGGSTDFAGELKFKKELTGSQLAELIKILGEDCRDHPEWGEGDPDYVRLNLSYIQFELLEDFSGIKWDENEKFYDAVEKVNLVTRLMREHVGDFELIGQLNAQGEEFNDRWVLRMSNGQAFKEDVIIVGQKITCPCCEEEFTLED